MEYLIDSANLDDIANYGSWFPYCGITCNPTIIRKEGRIDFFSHLEKIKTLIGEKKQLHVQVVSATSDGMIKEAHRLAEKIGADVYVKIPVTEEGLQAIRILKKENFNITATAIYSAIQGFLAIGCGADYLAPYYNRIESNNGDPEQVIGSFYKMIAKENSRTKILAASFKNSAQVVKAILAGAHAVTLSSELLKTLITSPVIDDAVQNFQNDWKSIFGEKLITDL